ncbi:TRAP transporter small permease [Pelagicoccus mobilis]|uniref:TRAP transporter small permease n=1 Tax=Pelagicoccus mobilis TaxID=415221 RepID=A0A934RYZ0_9BACT|nr:TRAP transporter small permease [Pelagicoccus mobilis]MBK1880285.1 TRAP transporter small permease [Pelagicoccus mobilis]
MNTHPKDAEESQSENTITWLDWPALILFSALMVIVFLQFFTRYFLNDSLGWTEEIARYLLIGLVFSGSLSVVHRGEHIFLEVIHRLAPRPNSKPLALVSEVAGFAYYLALGVFAFFLMADTDQSLVSVNFPKAAIYGFVAATLIVSAVFAANRIKGFAGKSSEEIYKELDEKATAED